MKKIILFLIAFLAFLVPTRASDNINEKITLKDIKITNFELLPFEGDVEINYELIPNDVEAKEIIWSISGLEKGVTVEIDNYKTSKAVGVINLKVKNTNDSASTFKLNAKSGKISKIVTVKVENQVATETRYKEEVVKEIEALIESAKKIDEKNELAIEKAIKNIEVMLKNEEVRKSVKESAIEDFDTIKARYEEYKNEDKTDYKKIGIISLLVLAFLFGLYMIFKGTKKEVKKPIKVEPKKQNKKKK